MCGYSNIQWYNERINKTIINHPTDLTTKWPRGRWANTLQTMESSNVRKAPPRPVSTNALESLRFWTLALFLFHLSPRILCLCRHLSSVEVLNQPFFFSGPKILNKYVSYRLCFPLETGLPASWSNCSAIRLDAESKNRNFNEFRIIVYWFIGSCHLPLPRFAHKVVQSERVLPFGPHKIADRFHVNCHFAFASGMIFQCSSCH